MFYRGGLPHDREAIARAVSAALEQDHQPVELILVDDRGSAATLDFLPDSLRSDRRILHLPGGYPSRAAALNAAIERAGGAYLLLTDGQLGSVILRRSAVRAMVMAARRHDRVGMVYADYARIDPADHTADVHLLDHHAGRLRDTTDYGPMRLFPTQVLREIGGFDESYATADLYDLRLRIGERHEVIHVANRRDGALYAVSAPPGKHNVFDYLLADRPAQLEFERALTDHLKRTGAYLAPGAGICEVAPWGTQKPGSDRCIASVVIPVNHRPEFIGSAIESVQAQTVRDIEAIVVVNGGPDDPTIRAVRRYQEAGDRHNPAAPPVRLLVLDVNNIGLSLNAGIEAAAGAYYVQLDSDDRLKPDAVERMLAVFESDRRIGMVIGSYEVWDLDPETRRIARNPDISVVRHEEWTDDNGRNNLLRINGAGAPRAAYTRVIREIGGFGLNDVPYCRNYGEDYDLVLRISERYRIGRVTEPIYEVIRHPGGTDHSIDQATIDRNDEAKDHMRLEALRRRQVGNRSR